MGDRAGEPVQLALALAHTESFAREDFVAGPANAEALAMIEGWPDAWPARTLALVGPAGAGKSHLAAIWAARAGARTAAAAILQEEVVSALAAAGAGVVEDIHDPALSERALFHLLNLTKEQGGYLLLTASRLPATLPIRTADLASRLRAVPVARLRPPDDGLLRAVLTKLFADRQLTIEESLLTYLERRIERSFSAARRVVEALDCESMRRRRPLTRALAAEVLEHCDTSAGGEPVIPRS